MPADGCGIGKTWLNFPPLARAAKELGATEESAILYLRRHWDKVVAKERQQ
jgi:hypothetical protein